MPNAFTPSKFSEKRTAALAGPVKRTPPARIAAAEARDDDDGRSFFFISAEVNLRMLILHFFELRAKISILSRLRALALLQRARAQPG
jgi:hypothetical protein